MTDLRRIGPVRGLTDLPGCYAGLSLSAAAAGLALVEDGAAYLGELHPGRLQGVDRLLWIRDQIGEFLRRHHPRLAALKGYRHSERGLADLGEVGGLARVLLHEGRNPYLVVPAPALSLFASDGGSATRPSVLRDLVNRWGVAADGDPEADAAVLSIISACAANPAGIQLSGPQRAALANLRRE